MNSEEIEIEEKYRRAIGDIILWNTPAIIDENSWPKRKRYSFIQLFSEPEHRIETKMIVHGYLGYKASKEMEQFFTHGELKRSGSLLHVAPSKVICQMYFQKNLTLYIRTHLLHGRFYHTYIKSRMKYR